MSNTTTQKTSSTRKSYFLGLGIGFLPLVIFTILLIGFNSLIETKMGLLLVPLAWLVFLVGYLCELIMAIINLTHPNKRTRGYGLLTALLLSLVLSVLIYGMFTIIFTRFL